jgi:cytoskeletal protein RodZ
MIAEEDPVPESDAMAADPLTDNGNDTTQAASAPLITEPILQDEGTSLLPQVNIELTYSGDCWTEVSDASGRRLFYDLGTAGRVVSIGGDAPLRLVLGDRNNVSITVEGRDYPMPNSPRGARLARLTINRP